MPKLDFDAWRELAAADPALFEIKRREALLEAVGKARASSQPALTALVDEITQPSETSREELAVSSFNSMLSAYGQLTVHLSDLAKQLGERPAAPDALALFTRLDIVTTSRG